jgi:hypothetical protein
MQVAGRYRTEDPTTSSLGRSGQGRRLPEPQQDALSGPPFHLAARSFKLSAFRQVLADHREGQFTGTTMNSRAAVTWSKGSVNSTRSSSLRSTGPENGMPETRVRHARLEAVQLSSCMSGS